MRRRSIYRNAGSAPRKARGEIEEHDEHRGARYQMGGRDTRGLRGQGVPLGSSRDWAAKGPKLSRVDDPTDLEYVRQGGILHQVLRERIAAN